MVKHPAFIFLFAGLLVSGFFADIEWWPFKADLPITPESSAIALPRVTPEGGYYTEDVGLIVDADPAVDTEGLQSRSTIWNGRPWHEDALGGMSIIEKDGFLESRLSLISTGRQWRRPLFGLPRGVPLTVYLQGEEACGPSLTHTYFFGQKHELPVVALTADPSFFFGSDTGIYVEGAQAWATENFKADNRNPRPEWWDAPANYHQRGKKWERPVYVEFFDREGKRTYGYRGSVRLNGNATRSFPQKSLRLYARAALGPDTLRHALFDQPGPDRFSSVILRNGGNDWGHTLFRDGFAAALAEPLNVDCQRYQPTVVYLNGEYWGIHNFRDRLNEAHFAIWCDVPEDSVAMLEKSSEVYHGAESDRQDFLALLEYAKTEDAKGPAYLSHVGTQVDLDNLIDYILTECWLANTDWPHNNVKYWRVQKQGNLPHRISDNHWRWMLYDTDYGLGYTHPTAYTTDMFAHLEQSGAHVAQLFFALMRNPEFRNNVQLRAKGLMQNEWRAEFVVPKLNAMQDQIRSEVPNHLKRWRRPGSLSDWEEEVEVMRRFVLERNAYFDTHLDNLIARYR